MGRPPRIPVLLPWEKPVVYFVTLCEEDRRPAWANTEFFHAFHGSVHRLEDRKLWYILAAVVMPDHLHVLVSPILDRDQPVGQFSAALKRWVRSALPSPSWKWQEGAFDRLLRSDESIAEKWEYIRENPVRAGLVEHWNDWPWSLGLRKIRDPLL